MRGTKRSPVLLAPHSEATGTDYRADIRQLIASANELLAMAIELGMSGARPDQTESSLIALSPAALARSEYAARRLRDGFFDHPGLFGEPGWDLLLDLFVASEAGKRVAVTSACIGAAVPTTTGLRWLALLEAQGLVCREADPDDARRALVWLSDDAITRMRDYFARLRRNGLR